MKLTTYYKFLLGGMFVASFLASCVKDRNSLATDFSNLQPMVEIRDPVKNDAGLLNFSIASLNLSGDPDTLSFYVNLASPTALGKDLTVTVGVNTAALNSYNALGGIQYQVFPDSTFKFVSKTVVIKAGEHVSLVKVVFYTSKIDPSVNYMLPAGITDAQGLNISGNFGTIYYHVIGNPLAGKYTKDYSRWSTAGNADTTTAPNGGFYTGHTVTISPLTPNIIQTPEDYIQTFVGGSDGIAVSFTNTAGVASGPFNPGFDATTTADLAAGGFTVNTAPVLVKAVLAGNPANHYQGTTFRTYMVLINSSGGYRTVIDNYVKQ